MNTIALQFLARLSVLSIALSVSTSVVDAGTGGRIQRAWTAGGSKTERVYDVAALADGSCVIVGEFWGTASFGTTQLVSAGESDVFVARYNAKGVLLWAKRGGGIFSDRGTQVTIQGGAIQVKGSAFGIVSFDAVNASLDYERTFSVTYGLDGSVTSVVTNDNFELFELPPRRAAYDDSGAAVDVGEFTLALPLDTLGPAPATLRSAGLKDAFIAEYSVLAATPQLRWAISGGGSNNDWATAIDFVPDDNTIVVAGNYEGSADIQGTDAVVTHLPASQGSTDIFVLRITLSDDDNDGLSNLRERSLVAPTNSQLADTDGDGFSDAVELSVGSNPTSAAAMPTSFDTAMINSQFATTTPLTVDSNGMNGIPDSDEFALLVASMSDDCATMAANVRTAFAANLARVCLDTDVAKAPMTAANSRKTIYAAYLTLGDSASRSIAKAALSVNEGVVITLSNYSTGASSYLPANGHADGDANNNLAEYNAAFGVRSTYLTAALSPNCPP